MYQNSLEHSCLGFIGQAQMLDTKTTITRKCQKEQYSCREEGRGQGVEETSNHILSSRRADSDLRVSLKLDS